MTNRKTAKATEDKFGRRSIQTMSGFKVSDDRVFENRVQAIAVQAELDLMRIMFHYIDLEEGFGVGEVEAKKKTADMFRLHRDDFIDLLRSAYMSPNELDKALDDDADAGIGALSPNRQEEARRLCGLIWNSAWDAATNNAFRHDQPNKTNSFDKWFRMRTDNDLRSIVSGINVEQVLTEDVNTHLTLAEEDARIAFKAGFLVHVETGKSVNDLFDDWWKTQIPAVGELIDVAYIGENNDDIEKPNTAKPTPLEDLPSPVRQRVMDRAMKAFHVWRDTHPTKSADEVGNWNSQGAATQTRFIEEARRTLMV